MEEFKLIEGRFSPIEAKELLLSLIGSKIRYHTNKNFSAEICTGEPDTNSLEKISSLRSAREKIITLLEETQNNEFSIELKSSVKIYFPDNSEPVNPGIGSKGIK